MLLELHAFFQPHLTALYFNWRRHLLTFSHPFRPNLGTFPAAFSATLSCLLLVGLSFSQTVIAQTHSAPAHDPAPSGIETVVITANRYESVLKNVPASIGVVDAEQLTNIAPVHINESLGRVAGVWISRGNGQEHLTAIRSPVLTGAGGCGAFFMALDGVSLRAPGFCNTNQLFGVNAEQAGQIEILRGPQSALYGANALHGVINVISPEISLLPELSMQGELGGYGYQRGLFVWKEEQVNNSFSVLGHLTKDEGYKDDSGFAQQKLTAMHQTQVKSFKVKNLLSFTNLNQETAGFVQGFEAYKDDDLKSTNPNPEAYRDSLSVNAQSRWRKQINTNQYWQLMPYFRYHDMAFLMHFLPWQPVEKNGHRSLGMQGQYVQQHSDWQWVAGIDVDWSNGWLSEVQAEPFSPSLPQGVHYDYQVESINVSPYASAQWQLLPQLTVFADGRFDYLEYDYDTLVSAGSACESDVDNCRFTRPASQTVSFSDVSFKVGAQYFWSEKHQIYSAFSQGFRPPQASELFRLQAGQTIARLDSENLLAWEFGVKGQSDNWRYAVSWFDMKKDNVIFQDTARQNIDNGETDHQGVELDIYWQFAENWFVAGSGTFAEHRYRNAIQISRAGNIQGNDIDTAPDKMGNIRLGWQQGEHSISAEWVIMGDYYLDPANSAQYAGHDLFNVRAAMQLNPQWRLSARLLNLLGEDYAERADFGFGNYRYFVGEPRSLYVSLRYQLSD